MFYKVIPDLDPIHQAKPSLLWPHFSFSKSGQLATEVLLANCPTKTKIGTILNPYVLPITGADSLAVESSDRSGILAFPVEVYYLDHLNLVVIQQRSPIMKGKSRSFVNDVLDMANNLCINLIINLVSSHSPMELHYCRTQGLLPIKYQIDHSSHATNSLLDSLIATHWGHLELYPSDPAEQYVEIKGTHKHLIDQSKKRSSNTQLCHLAFFSERGISLNAGLRLFGLLNAWLHILPTQQTNSEAEPKIPISLSSLLQNDLIPDLY